MLSEAQCLSSLNMSDSLIKLSLPCYEGFMKLVIWPEPESVSKINISCSLEKLDFLLIFCYGLVSADPISDPQLTGRSLVLPFYHGCRYAAIPGTSTDGSIQVDICLRRPESLVYHHHCLHLADLKVNLSFFILPYICDCCLDSPTYAEL